MRIKMNIYKLIIREKFFSSFKRKDVFFVKKIKTRDLFRRHKEEEEEDIKEEDVKEDKSKEIWREKTTRRKTKTRKRETSTKSWTRKL